MNKIFKKIGLSASVAFAFMFATSLGVAQEKTAINMDIVEAKESVEVKVLAGTVQKLNAAWTPSNLQNNSTKIEVMKEPLTSDGATLSNERRSPQWFLYNPGQPIHQAASYSPLNAPLNSLCPEGEVELCAIFVAPNSGDGQTPDAAELATMVSQIQDAVDNGESIPDLVRIKD